MTTWERFRAEYRPWTPPATTIPMDLPKSIAFQLVLAAGTVIASYVRAGEQDDPICLHLEVVHHTLADACQETRDGRVRFTLSHSQIINLCAATRTCLAMAHEGQARHVDIPDLTGGQVALEVALHLVCAARRSPHVHAN